MTSNSLYYSKASSIYDEFYKTKQFGIFPSLIQKSKYISGDIKFNRFYDYLLKVSLLNENQEEYIMYLYKKAKSAIFERLIKRNNYNKLLFVGSLMKLENNRKYNSIMEMSYCNIVSMFALDAISSTKPGESQKEMEIAKSLIYTFHNLHMKTLTKLVPESVDFNNNLNIVNPINELNGEYAEALFLMYQATNDPIFQKWGWDFYLAIEKNTKVEYGYSGMKDVNRLESYSDIIHPEFGGKTLKYLYLLFGKVKQIDVRNYIFNVNGHLFEV